MCRMQREAVRAERGVGPREVDTEVLLGAVREDIRDLRRLHGGLEERGGVGRLWEVVNHPVGPRAGGVGAREGRIYPGAKVGMVDASLDGRTDERALEPMRRAS